MSGRCDEVRLELEAHLRGKLGGHEAKAVADHLESCGGCRAVAARVGPVVKLLEAQPAPPFDPDALAARVIARSRGRSMPWPAIGLTLAVVAGAVFVLRSKGEAPASGHASPQETDVGAAPRVSPPPKEPRIQPEPEATPEAESLPETAAEEPEPVPETEAEPEAAEPEAEPETAPVDSVAPVSPPAPDTPPEVITSQRSDPPVPTEQVSWRVGRLLGSAKRVRVDGTREALASAALLEPGERLEVERGAVEVWGDRPRSLEGLALASHRLALGPRTRAVFAAEGPHLESGACWVESQGTLLADVGGGRSISLRDADVSLQVERAGVVVVQPWAGEARLWRANVAISLEVGRCVALDPAGLAKARKPAREPPAWRRLAPRVALFEASCRDLVPRQWTGLVGNPGPEGLASVKASDTQCITLARGGEGLFKAEPGARLRFSVRLRGPGKVEVRLTDVRARRNAGAAIDGLRVDRWTEVELALSDLTDAPADGVLLDYLVVFGPPLEVRDVVVAR